jgi:hypothetical protein
MKDEATNLGGPAAGTAKAAIVSSSAPSGTDDYNPKIIGEFRANGHALAGHGWTSR